jgi:AmmeMemoRadiSam system protein A
VSGSGGNAGVPSGGLGPEERGALLRAARESIAAHLLGRPATLPAASGRLAERRGAFVTLRGRDGDLRGCVGRIRSDEPLLRTVAGMAVAAAAEDGRFPPVGGDELGHLRIEVSVLGPMAPIRPEEVDVGRHGLLIEHQGRRGVLLPQVPVEHGWDRAAFLGHTCRKAGLPEDAWKEPGAGLLAFTADVFGE